jgi:hypothetical protein
MANQVIQDSINYALTYIQYAPISAGTNNEPAITIANEIQNMFYGPPFTWPNNRKEDSSTSTVAGTQDYTINLTDFAYLEKVSLTDPNGIVYDVPDIYNNLAKGLANATSEKRMRPNSCCVLIVTYGTSVKIRFIGVPDQIYLITLTYQKLITPMSTLTGGTGTWTIPPQFSDVYNSLFLGEAMAVAGDERANQHRQRGVATLLSKAQGLTELEINAFLEQYWSRVNYQQAQSLRTAQGTQGRGI